MCHSNQYFSSDVLFRNTSRAGKIIPTCVKAHSIILIFAVNMTEMRISKDNDTAQEQVRFMRKILCSQAIFGTANILNTSKI